MANTCRPAAATLTIAPRCATISSTVTAAFASKRRNLTCSLRSSASLRIHTVCRSATRDAISPPFFASRASPKYPIAMSIAAPLSRIETAAMESQSLPKSPYAKSIALQQRIAPQHWRTRTATSELTSALKGEKERRHLARLTIATLRSQRRHHLDLAQEGLAHQAVDHQQRVGRKSAGRKQAGKL